MMVLRRLEAKEFIIADELLRRLYLDTLFEGDIVWAEILPERLEADVW